MRTAGELLRFGILPLLSGELVLAAFSYLIGFGVGTTLVVTFGF